MTFSKCHYTLTTLFISRTNFHQHFHFPHFFPLFFFLFFLLLILCLTSLVSSLHFLSHFSSIQRHHTLSPLTLSPLPPLATVVARHHRSNPKPPPTHHCHLLPGHHPLQPQPSSTSTITHCHRHTPFPLFCCLGFFRV